MPSSNESTTCIGRYCGFPPDPDIEGEWQKDRCGACPWGYRSNDTKFCIKCSELPGLYDWLYLGFMFLLPCTLHWLFILRNRSRVKVMAVQLLLSFVECASAAFLAIISTEPKGKLKLVSCGVERLSDWYPMFYNPQIRYTETLHCTQEAVYPLLTLVCIYYAYTLGMLLILRPIIMSRIAISRQWRDSVYAALYFHPVLIVVQAFVGGLLYYAFPFITVLLSIVALAAYFVWTDVTELRTLFRLHCVENFLIILWHFLLLGYGIIGIIASSGYFYFVFLVPIPLAFYFLTVDFSDPDNIAKEMR